MLERFYRWCVPEARLQEDDLNARLTRFVVLVTAATLVLYVTTGPFAIWLLHQPIIGQLLLVGALFRVVVLRVIRYTTSVRPAAWVLILGSVGEIGVLILGFSADRALFYAWFPYLVALAAFALGRRWGAVLVGVFVTLIWGFEVWYVVDHPFAGAEIDNPYALALSATLALFMTGVLVWLFEFTHQMAEQRLYTSEQRLRLYLEQTPLAVLTMTDAGVITEWNPGAVTKFGYTREEAVGRSVDDLILWPADHADSRRVHATFAGLLSHGGTAHQVNSNRTKDGEALLCEWFNTALVDERGAPVGIASLGMNVSERQRAEDALRVSEARFRLLAEQSPDYIIIFEAPARRATYVNRSTFLGHAWSAVETAEALLKIVLPEDVEGLRAAWLPATSAEAGEITSHEFRARSSSGAVEWIRSRESVLARGADGETTMGLATLTVITDEKRREEELRQAKEEAETMALARSRFLANMSHEIRTPMNGIIGMTSLLLDSDLDEQHRDFVDTIRASGEALLTIINAILDLSKIESGRMEMELRPFDLRQCVEGALDLLAPQAAVKRLELTYRQEDDVPAAIVGDMPRLRQVLVNLLANAVKFTEKGEVAVGAECLAKNGQVELLFSVRDTGIGISADKIPHLFTAFSQVDASASRRFGGTGLGLIISQRLVELMGGAMWVESTEGAGSTFFFTLQAEPVQPAPVAPDAGVSLAGRRMLIVAANATMRAILASSADRWGMGHGEAADAAGAHRLVAGGEPWDAIVADMDLPDQAGLALAQSLRRAPGLAAGKPIILLASLAHAHLRSGAEAAGIDAYLYKPLKPLLLREVLIDHVLGRRLAPASHTARTPALDARVGRENPFSLLLAEDNVVNQKVALLLLERLGYRADVAANGVEVVESLHRQPYDVILMDVHMPTMDGIEATRQIKELFPPARQPYIIAMTAAAMQEDRERCAAVGMQDFLSKPVNVEELVVALLRAAAWLDEHVEA